MKKCFCHFNGYEVKDANARNEIKATNKRLDKEIETLDKRLNTESSRINTFTTLQEGSTTGDAELIDARIDFEGVTHDSLGEHIRKVTSKLSSELNNLDSIVDG